MNLLEEISTQLPVLNFIFSPSSALIISGEQSSAVYVAKHIVSAVLQIEDLDNYPYILMIEPEKQSIGIDQVRQIQAFLTLKVPIEREINRAVIIKSGDKMTSQAQTALLKTLEDSSEQNLIIIASSGVSGLLPTIISRCQIINLRSSSKESIEQYFIEQGYEQKDINLSYLISRGSLDKIADILTDQEHPLRIAAEDARELLKSDTYHKALIMDKLSKQSDRLLDVAYVLQQMAHVSLIGSDDPINTKRWHRVLRSASEFESNLLNNANVKLAALRLALSL